MNGLVPIGDALATTNPAFGRGMSMALMHAEIVTEVLGTAGSEASGRSTIRWAPARPPGTHRASLPSSRIEHRYPTPLAPRPARARAPARYGPRSTPPSYGDVDLIERLSRTVMPVPAAVSRDDLVRALPQPVGIAS